MFDVPEIPEGEPSGAGGAISHQLQVYSKAKSNKTEIELRNSEIVTAYRSGHPVSADLTEYIPTLKHSRPRGPLRGSNIKVKSLTGPRSCPPSFCPTKIQSQPEAMVLEGLLKTYALTLALGPSPEKEKALGLLTPISQKKRELKI